MITPGMGHLGARVSALLDGQLSPAEAERAWAHVHGCHACRDQVEREGWLKRRLAGLAQEVASPSAPADLKGSLLGVGPDGPLGAPGRSPYASLDDRDRPGPAGLPALAVLGGGALGAAVVGALVLGVGSGGSPGVDRTPPVTSISRSPATPVRSQTQPARPVHRHASPPAAHRHSAFPDAPR